jgi:TPP-dependent pyruvate/acetoin dehydrogenase alpha subunit
MDLWTVEKLKEFEKEIAELFNAGKIRAPIHLSDGYEESILEIFKEVGEKDWIFGSWRSHYQCLLKGVDPDLLKKAIVDGRSIALCFPEKRIFSTAIVGGQLPIAVGAALAIKMRGGSEKVWCFLGDMTSETGIAQTSIRYANLNQLPITFIIEDNGLSTYTDTRAAWGAKTLRFEESFNPAIRSYKYKSQYPHSGAGIRVQF